MVRSIVLLGYNREGNVAPEITTIGLKFWFVSVN